MIGQTMKKQEGIATFDEWQELNEIDRLNNLRDTFGNHSHEFLHTEWKNLNHFPSCKCARCEHGKGVERLLNTHKSNH